MHDPFGNPAGGDPFGDPPTGFTKVTDFANQVLIVKPLRRVDGLTTQLSKAPGDTSAVDADIVVLYPDGRWEEHTNVRIFQKALIAQLTQSIGRMVIGRLTKAPTGRGEAWVLAKVGDQERALGRRYLDAKANQALQNPAQNQATAGHVQANAPVVTAAAAAGVDPLA